MKQKAILLIAIAAGIAAFWLTGKYLRYERERILGDAKRVFVVVAERELPAGTVLKNVDLAKALVFQSNVGGRAILPESAREIIGKKLLYNIGRGDPIQWSDVDVPFKGEAGLAEMINPSMRAISISVDAVSSVSAMIKPNDHVDILGTFTFPSPTAAGTVETVTLTVLQDVTILATGQTTADKAANYRRAERAPRGYNTVTFEVTPHEAELLVFAQSVRGKLSLALRNPADVTYITNMPTVNFEHLQQQMPALNMIRQRDIRHKKDI
ncbi:MAG: Flp pilus assembly protein CpaB [Kiritimatiellia bacterium]|nr:Flp pilus assembly protein CpaB [Kiritimatiellia bacterium]